VKNVRVGSNEQEIEAMFSLTARPQYAVLAECNCITNSTFNPSASSSFQWSDTKYTEEGLSYRDFKDTVSIDGYYSMPMEFAGLYSSSLSDLQELQMVISIMSTDVSYLTSLHRNGKLTALYQFITFYPFADKMYIYWGLSFAPHYVD